MTGNVIDLAKYLGNAKRSVADTLREVAKRIDSGEIKPDMVYVAMREPVEGSDNDVDYLWSTSQHSRFDRVGLLARHLYYANSVQ